MDGAVDATTAEEATVRRVDHGVDLLPRDVPSDDRDVHAPSALVVTWPSHSSTRERHSASRLSTERDAAWSTPGFYHRPGAREERRRRRPSGAPGQGARPAGSPVRPALERRDVEVAAACPYPGVVRPWLWPLTGRAAKRDDRPDM